MANLTISLDAMGGDHGPDVVLPGARLTAIRKPDARFLLFGDESRIRPLLDTMPDLAARSQVHHTDVAIAMDAKPSQALRQGRWKSSMWLAVDAVKSGDAQVAVSAGNTGAMMAMAKFCLRTVPGIERPVIAAIWPTVKSECVVLDVGANVGMAADQLVDSAIMGAAMARALFSLDRPTVGLLNIGVEEVKGVEELKRANAILRATDLPIMNYQGYVEADAVGQGVANVVVTEGFTGNIALKTAEGTAKQIGTYWRDALTSSIMAQVGAVFARGALAILKDKMDPRKLNGGVFLGLNGVVIKSHGGTDPIGFASAVDLAYDMARNDLASSIASNVRKLNDNPAMLAGT